MTLELRVDAQGYRLSLEGQLLAHLGGGAAALLAGAGPRVREADLEAAIERAEDWLMPSSRSWQGMEIWVRDDAGRLRAGMGGAQSLTSDEVERAFSCAVDDATRGRAISADFVADLLLLRELVHHGKVTRVHLE